MCLSNISMNEKQLSLERLTTVISHHLLYRLVQHLHLPLFKIINDKEVCYMHMLASFFNRKGTFLCGSAHDSSSCINISSFTSSSYAKCECINQSHLGKRSLSATNYLSVELVITSPSFFHTFIIAPLPIVRCIT